MNESFSGTPRSLTLHRNRMKRGALRRRARGVSVMLVVLVCATVIIWTWDRTPTSAFLPPESQYLKLQTEEKVEKIPTALNTETKDSYYSSATPLVNKEGNKEDSTNNKDAEEEEEEKQVEEVTVRETNQGKTSIFEEKTPEQREVTVREPKYRKTPTSEENRLEQVNREVAVSDAEGLKATHIKETNSDSEDKILATDEEKTKHLAANEDDGSTSTARVTNQACNYAKGKWVVDNHRPLYSGSGCKQWLASMWACRLMQRTDFAFERLRWQPKDCSMEEFERSKFLRK